MDPVLIAEAPKSGTNNAQITINLFLLYIVVPFRLRSSSANVNQSDGKPRSVFSIAILCQLALARNGLRLVHLGRRSAK
jgi:hypothetical protein